MLAAASRLIIFVGDVERCADFYRTAFDLETIPSDLASDEWQELDAGGLRIALHKAPGRKGPTGGANNPHKLVFKADDVAAVRETLVERGAKMGEVKTFSSGVTVCDGQDPEGHRFQISSR